MNLAQEATVPLVLNHIAKIAINVHDLPRAIAFSAMCWACVICSMPAPG